MESRIVMDKLRAKKEVNQASANLITLAELKEILEMIQTAIPNNEQAYKLRIEEVFDILAFNQTAVLFGLFRSASPEVLSRIIPTLSIFLDLMNQLKSTVWELAYEKLIATGKFQQHSIEHDQLTALAGNALIAGNDLPNILAREKAKFIYNRLNSTNKQTYESIYLEATRSAVTAAFSPDETVRAEYLTLYQQLQFSTAKTAFVARYIELANKGSTPDAAWVPICLNNAADSTPEQLISFFNKVKILPNINWQAVEQAEVIAQLSQEYCAEFNDTYAQLINPGNEIIEPEQETTVKTFTEADLQTLSAQALSTDLGVRTTAIQQVADLSSEDKARFDRHYNEHRTKINNYAKFSLNNDGSVRSQYFAIYHDLITQEAKIMFMEQYISLLCPSEPSNAEEISEEFSRNFSADAAFVKHCLLEYPWTEMATRYEKVADHLSEINPNTSWSPDYNQENSTTLSSSQEQLLTFCEYNIGLIIWDIATISHVFSQLNDIKLMQQLSRSIDAKAVIDGKDKVQITIVGFDLDTKTLIYFHSLTAEKATSKPSKDADNTVINQIISNLAWLGHETFRAAIPFCWQPDPNQAMQQIKTFEFQCLANGLKALGNSAGFINLAPLVSQIFQARGSGTTYQDKPVLVNFADFYALAQVNRAVPLPAQAGRTNENYQSYILLGQMIKLLSYVQIKISDQADFTQFIQVITCQKEITTAHIGQLLLHLHGKVDTSDIAAAAANNKQPKPGKVVTATEQPLVYWQRLVEKLDTFVVRIKPNEKGKKAQNNVIINSDNEVEKYIRRLMHKDDKFNKIEDHNLIVVARLFLTMHQPHTFSLTGGGNKTSRDYSIDNLKKMTGQSDSKPTQEIIKQLQAVINQVENNQFTTDAAIEEACISAIFSVANQHVFGTNDTNITHKYRPKLFAIAAWWCKNHNLEHGESRLLFEKSKKVSKAGSVTSEDRGSEHSFSDYGSDATRQSAKSRSNSRSGSFDHTSTGPVRKGSFSENPSALHTTVVNRAPLSTHKEVATPDSEVGSPVPKDSLNPVRKNINFKT